MAAAGSTSHTPDFSGTENVFCKLAISFIVFGRLGSTLTAGPVWHDSYRTIFGGRDSTAHLSESHFHEGPLPGVVPAQRVRSAPDRSLLHDSDHSGSLRAAPVLPGVHLLPPPAQPSRPSAG